jgi:WD40-like Beta Propeller Repeat
MRLVGLVLVVACGRVDFDPQVLGDGSIVADTRDGAMAACTAFGPWAVPQTIVALNSTDTDWGPHLSHDGLELVFASTRNGGNDGVFSVTRPSVSDAWSAPVIALDPSTFGGTEDPDLSNDRLTLYWGAGGIHRAVRPIIAAAWVDQGVVPITTDGFSIDGGPWISPDNLRLLFTGTEINDGKWHQYETTRASLAAPFVTATPVPLAHTPAGEAYGSYRGDALEIIFETEAGPQQLLAATRATLADDFGTASPITELDDSTFNNGDPELSDDGTTLWFSSSRPGGLGGYDLWMTTRSCL